MNTFRLVLAGLFLMCMSGNVLAQEMPQEVRERIKNLLADRYPDNYSMQKTLLDDQIESYVFLENYDPEGVPSDVLERIKKKLVSRYPNNFSMQKTLVEDQVNSYKELNE